VQQGQAFGPSSACFDSSLFDQGFSLQDPPSVVRKEKEKKKKKKKRANPLLDYQYKLNSTLLNFCIERQKI